MKACTAISVVLVGLLSSCAPEKPQGPQSDKTDMPWNPPVPGQGAGAFGGMPQQPRR